MSEHAKERKCNSMKKVIKFVGFGAALGITLIGTSAFSIQVTTHASHFSTLATTVIWVNIGAWLGGIIGAISASQV